MSISLGNSKQQQTTIRLYRKLLLLQKRTYSICNLLENRKQKEIAMWLCKYDSSLSNIKDGRDAGDAMDGRVAFTKDKLIGIIRIGMMDNYLRHPRLEPDPEAGVKCCIKVRCALSGNVYWYDLIDLDDIETMDKELYRLEYEEYAEIRKRWVSKL